MTQVMPSSVPRLLCGIVATAVCIASADRLASSEAYADGRVATNASEAKDSAETMVDSYALLQTDLFVAPHPQKKCRNPADAGNASASVDILRKIWHLVTQADQPTASTNDITEVTKRYHKDFIVAALLMTCVLPWSCRNRGSGDRTRRAPGNRLWNALPSGQYLRYLSVILLWLKHYWFHGQHLVPLEMMFVLVGVILEFADQHSDDEDDMWKRLGDCMPQRFVRLYPLYALHVIACYLIFFSSPCNAIENLLGGNLLLSYTCGLGAWLISVVFACYLVGSILSSPPQHIESSSVAMLCAGCVAMVVLPRTLAAPVHGPSAWTEDRASLTHSNSDGVGYELFFARRSLLQGLAHFFLGLVLARLRLAVSSGPLISWLGFSHVCKERPQVAASRDSVRPHEDLWREFEDEARRDIIRGLSVSTAADDIQLRSASTNSIEWDVAS